MNVDTIAAVAGHAAIFRTYGFKMICTSPHTVAESLGRALTITDAWGKAVEAGVLEPVDAFMELATSEAGALARVGEVLKKLMPHDPDFLANVDAMIAGRPAEW